MAVKSGKRVIARSVLGAAMLATLAGCAQSYEQQSSLSAEPRSIIASIGFSGTVTFDPPKAAETEKSKEAATTRPGVDIDWWGTVKPKEPGEVAIPITIVQNLPKLAELPELENARQSKSQHSRSHDTETPDSRSQESESKATQTGLLMRTRVSASVFGISPPTDDEYFLRTVAPETGNWPVSNSRTITLNPFKLSTKDSSVRNQQIELVLSASYVKRLKSYDQLRIQVQVEDTYEDPDRTKIVEAEEVIRAKREEIADEKNRLRTFLRNSFEELPSSTQRTNIMKREDDTTYEPRSDEYVDEEIRGMFDAIENQIRPGWIRTEAQWKAAVGPLQKAMRDERNARSAIDRLTAERPVVRTKSTNAVRTITMVEREDYRTKRLQKAVPIYEMTAFPLSSTQTQYLFGDKIDRNFYVVGLSMQNSSTEDRLVNSGMIKVSGQALVRTTTSSEGWFSIPVQVAPQSREHVYAILDDEEVNEPRAIAFRALEFVGALATAITTGFNGSEESIRALGIYTGIAIPEGKKLIPDRMPGYKRNVVNYVMPNLVKIGRGTSSPPYFLFFSKTQLQGMVLDSQLFTQEDAFKLVQRNESVVTSSPVNVASLSFDSMEVPFEIAAPESLLAGEPRVAAAIQQSNAASVERALSEQRAAEAELARLEGVRDSRTAIEKTSTLIASESTQHAETIATIVSKAAGGAVKDSLGSLKSALGELAASSTLLASSTARDVNERWEGFKSRRSVVTKGAAKAVGDAKDYLSAHPADEQAKSDLEAVRKLEEDISATLKRGDSLGGFARTSELERGDLDAMLRTTETRVKEAKGLVEREQQRYDEFMKTLVRGKATPAEVKPESSPPK